MLLRPTWGQRSWPAFFGSGALAKKRPIGGLCDWETPGGLFKYYDGLKPTAIWTLLLSAGLAARSGTEAKRSALCGAWLKWRPGGKGGADPEAFLGVPGPGRQEGRHKPAVLLSFAFALGIAAEILFYRLLLVGKKIAADSPAGRFLAGNAQVPLIFDSCNNANSGYSSSN